ncbi:MAG: DUF933 domain-containing protein [Deltaproteobacteria bacterium]
MKACVVGIPDFPFGKKPLPDGRLKKIEELYKAQKVTTIQVEYVPDKDLKTADVIVAPAARKLDLVIMDMEVLEARLEKPLEAAEEALLRRAQQLLEKEEFLNAASWSEDEKRVLVNVNLVTLKPVVLTAEGEQADLPALTRRAYDAAGRIVFLTGGPKEARAWEIRRGATAVDAAGAIHSDIARGFIRAEVMAFDALVQTGNVHQAKSSGCLRQENKEYVVQDGDVVEFKFSV